MRDDGPARGDWGVGKEEPDQAEADEPADQLGGDEEQGRRRGDAGESVGEDPANRHRRVRERRGAGEPIRRPDIGADRGRRQCRPPRSGKREHQQHQARRGHYLPETVTEGYPVLARDLHRG